MQKKIITCFFGAPNYFFQVLTPYHREVLSMSHILVYTPFGRNYTLIDKLVMLPLKSMAKFAYIIGLNSYL